jgi:hypothetical protein
VPISTGDVRLPPAAKTDVVDRHIDKTDSIGNTNKRNLLSAKEENEILF